MTGNNLRLIDTVQIRLAQRLDLLDLEWEGELAHFRNIFADAYRNLEQGTGLIWIAEIPSVGLIGQAIVSLFSKRHDLSNGHNRSYLYGFRVRPEYRNKGVGTLLMEKIEADLVKRGYQILTLNVAKDNHAALKLYERLGYRITGSEPGEWTYIDNEGHRREVREPAWKMEKLLS